MPIHRFKLQLKDSKLLPLYITKTSKAIEDKCKNVQLGNPKIIRKIKTHRFKGDRGHCP